VTTTATARTIAEPVYDVGGRFMLDGATFARGLELGLGGLAFYFCGRGGVLGRVDASVVASEFGVFEPANLALNWDSGLAVMDPTDAASEFIACGHAWGAANLADDLDAERLAELTFRVADAAGEGAPRLFVAWRDVERPADPRAAALHGVHLLRELRGGLHVAALAERQVDPHGAVVVRQGDAMAALLGWPEPHPDAAAVADVWDVAEEVTNERFAVALDVLDADEQAELVALVQAMV
jgi:hypothetical protein